MDAPDVQEPDPRLVDAQIRSMDTQDEAIRQMMAVAKEYLPLQKEQIQASLDAAKNQSSAILSAANTAAASASAAASAAAAPGMAQAMTAGRLADKAIELQDYQLNQMKRHDQRYWDVGVKVEDDLINTVQEQATQKYKDRQLGIASTGVQQAFDQAREQQLRDAASVGADPNSGAFAAGQSQLAAQKALGKAGTVNSTRMALQDRDMANKFQLYGGMKGLAGLGQTSAGLSINAINAGTGAVNAGTNAVAAGRSGGGAGGGNIPAYNPTLGLQALNSGVGSILQGFGNVASAAGGMGGNATSMYNGQSNFNLGAAKMESNDGAFGALGSLGGALISKLPMFSFSDRNMKEDITPVDPERALLAAERMPVSEWLYKADSAADDGGKKHVGPMAQDVNAVLGDKAAPGGKMIDLVSMNGVTLAALQGLSKKLDRVVQANGLEEGAKPARGRSKSNRQTA